MFSKCHEPASAAARGGGRSAALGAARGARAAAGGGAAAGGAKPELQPLTREALSRLWLSLIPTPRAGIDSHQSTDTRTRTRQGVERAKGTAGTPLRQLWQGHPGTARDCVPHAGPLTARSGRLPPTARAPPLKGQDAAANRVTDLLVAGLDGGEVEDDDDAAVLKGLADALVQPDDAELLQLPPQHAAPQVSALS